MSLSAISCVSLLRTFVFPLLLAMPSGQAHDGHARAADAVCGPLAVQRVLSHYGMHVPIHELVDEIQPSRQSYGSSLGDLDRALQRRNVFTAGLRIEKNVPLRWPYPVILHMLLPDGEPDGHFSVVTGAHSECDQMLTLWMGPGNVQHVTHQEIAPLLTGVILLTSPGPIDLSGSAYDASLNENQFGYSSSTVLISVTMVVVVLLCWLCFCEVKLCSGSWS